MSENHKSTVEELKQKVDNLFYERSNFDIEKALESKINAYTKYLNAINEYKQNVGELTNGWASIYGILNGTESSVPKFKDQFDHLLEQCDIIKDEEITPQQFGNILLYSSFFSDKCMTVEFVKRIKCKKINIKEIDCWEGFYHQYRNEIL